MNEPVPGSDAVNEEDRFHPEERQQTDSPPTDDNLKFAEYRDILNRESQRDKSWLIGLIGLGIFLAIAVVTLFLLFT